MGDAFELEMMAEIMELNEKTMSDPLDEYWAGQDAAYTHALAIYEDCRRRGVI